MADESKKEFTQEADEKESTETSDKTVKTGADGEEEERTFTQAELDDIIAKRLAREKEKQTETEAKLKRLKELEEAEEERKKAAMSEQERLQAEKEEAEKAAQEAKEKADKTLEAANNRIIDTEIRAVARDLKANDVDVVLALLDKENIEIDEEGNVKGVEEAVKELKESKEWMFKQSIGADASAGSNPTKNPTADEVTAKEKELEELKEKAVSDRSLWGKVTRLSNEIMGLKSKNK